MSEKYQVKVIKETIFDLDSMREAEIIADMLASREDSYNIANNFTIVYTEVNQLERV